MKAVKAVAEIDAKGDPMVAEVLVSINEFMANAQERAREEHRAATKDRHLRLKAMLASWRNAVQLLGQVDGKVTRLLQRTQIVDRHIANTRRSSGRPTAPTHADLSSLVQFFVSLFVLAIAIGGAVINFDLIARPMAEMVGGPTSSAAGAWPTSRRW